jgi:hypothetical protein
VGIMGDLSHQERVSAHNWDGSAVAGIVAILPKPEVVAC